tara:strand:- start:2979 stop:3248 length:270 start_codon:yes stop_codon:yes gene_type:complete
MKFRELVERILREYPEAEQQAAPGTVSQLASLATTPQQAKKAQVLATMQNIATNKLRKQTKIRARQEVDQIRKAAKEMKTANIQASRPA